MGASPPESAATANGDKLVSPDLPPAYEEIEAPPPVTILPLNLYYSAGSPRSSTVTRDECAAHLKFLAALADLRESISAEDGLFGICDEEANECPDRRNETLARIREKRWSVYTSRAVDRYSAWWQRCVPSSEERPTLQTLQSRNYSKITECSSRTYWRQKYMPPLGALPSSLFTGLRIVRINGYRNRCFDGMAFPHAQPQSLSRGLYSIR